MATFLLCPPIQQDTHYIQTILQSFRLKEYFRSEKLFLIARSSFSPNVFFFYLSIYRKYLSILPQALQITLITRSFDDYLRDIFVILQRRTFPFVNLFAGTHFRLARHVALGQLSNNKYCSWIICYWLALIISSTRINLNDVGLLRCQLCSTPI